MIYDSNTTVNMSMIYDSNTTVNTGYYFLTFTVSRGCFKSYQEFITDHRCAVGNKIFQSCTKNQLGAWKTLKKTRIKLYNTLAVPVLLYGSKTWTIKARDARRITAAEMKYMRRTAGYIWTDYKTNAQIAKELKITQILDKLLEYNRNRIHVNRMPRNRLPRVMKHYSPTGRRNHGRPLKRLLDTWDRNGSTSGPTPWQIYDDDPWVMQEVKNALQK